MSKAILVIDMPMCCGDCVFLDDNYDYPCCIATGQMKGYTFIMRENKMDKCPLKEAPKRINKEDVWDDYDEGWNACINEILGSK